MRTRARLKAKHWRRDTRKSCGRCGLCRLQGLEVRRLHERLRRIEDRFAREDAERVSGFPSIVERVLGFK